MEASVHGSLHNEEREVSMMLGGEDTKVEWRGGRVHGGGGVMLLLLCREFASLPQHM